MNIYKKDNITVNVTTINPEWIEITGDTVMTLNSEFVVELIENSCMFTEFFVHQQDEELYIDMKNYGDGIDSVVQYYSLLNEDVEIRSADAIIAVYKYALEETNEQFTFHVSTENISWVIHDMLHATHDAAGCTVYVESDIERQRILESLRITKEQFIDELPGYEFLENLESEFHDRFKEYIDLDEFKFLDEHLEEEEY